MKIDIGKLSQDETAELLKDCITALPEEVLFETLEKSLTKDQKEELGEGWFNIDRKV